MWRRDPSALLGISAHGSDATQTPLKFVGDLTAGDPPVPIPNTEVKPRRADCTARESVWESRSSPAYKQRLSTEMLVAFSFWWKCGHVARAPSPAKGNGPKISFCDRHRFSVPASWRAGAIAAHSELQIRADPQPPIILRRPHQSRLYRNMLDVLGFFLSAF